MKRKRQGNNGETRVLCKICNLWISNNRAQRDQHESGSKHKAAQAKVIKDIGEKNEVQRQKEQREQQLVNRQEPHYQNGNASSQLLHFAMSSLQRPPQQEISNGNGSGNAGEELGNSVVVSEKRHEQQDGDGDEEEDYPLPAGEVYGQWKDVEEDNDNNQVEKQEAPLIHSTVQTPATVQAKHTPTDEKADSECADTNGISNISFKRKLPNLSKRKKRRKS